MKKKVLLTATGGGHLEQLRQLAPLEKDFEVTYLLARTKVNESLKNVDFVPECRNERRFVKYWDLVKITLASFRYLWKVKPDVVISTGAISTFPVCFLQKKLFHKKVVFIESFAKRSSGTKTGKLVYRFADVFVVQWPEMKKVYPNAVYGGMIY